MPLYGPAAAQIAAALATVSPVFRVYKAAFQTLPANTPTVIAFDTEELDTHNDYAASKFTPTVAGNYWLNGQVVFDTTADLQELQVYMYKNGVVVARSDVAASGTGKQTAAVEVVVAANGTTDYFELLASSANTGRNVALDSSTFFQGARVS